MNTVVLPISKGLYISEYYAERNFRDSEVLFVGRFQGQGDIYRSLIYFDLGYLDQIIPPYNVIKSACLKMEIVRNDLLPGKKARISVYPVLEPWDDDKVNWKCQPVFTTCEKVVTSVTFGIKGSLDFVITPWVKGWYEKKRPNYGILIGGEEEEDALMALAGLKFHKVYQRPVLIINYCSSSN